LWVLADFSLSEGPNQVSRENGKPRVIVTADVRGREPRRRRSGEPTIV